MALARTVYALSGDFPADERFGPTAQIRRSAVSVPSNIAEGRARNGKRELLKFLYVARGSLSELETQRRLAHDFGFCNADGALSQVELPFGTMAGLIKAQSGKLTPDRPRSGRLTSRVAAD